MTDIIEYHKIPGPFKREVSGARKNKLIFGAWSTPELEILAEVPWIFTEKVDGTNIRVIWDGHKPEFRGRTDKAQLPPKLLAALAEMFPEELFEQVFGSNSVILFGEGYGAGIQKGGGNYRQDNSFILFDVRIGPWWLRRNDVENIAISLGIKVVPVMYEGALMSAVLHMMDKPLYSEVAEVAPRGKEKPLFVSEGMVGTPQVPLLARDGSRIIVKLKGCDLYGLQVD